MVATKTALVLEEDRATRGEIIERLKFEGFTAIECDDAEIARHVADLHAIDICLIGYRSGGRDALNLVGEIRRNTSAGIIVLGQSDDEVDAILALEMGADDYLAKPVRLREMCARARSVMRRTFMMRTNDDTPRPLPETFLRRIGDLEICGVARSVALRGKPVELTAMEFDVLSVLAARTNAVLSRERIIEAIRGSDWAANDRTVDGIISRLRRKVFPGDSGKLWIKTVHGRGYMLVEQA